jgi:hypothetical protein
MLHETKCNVAVEIFYGKIDGRGKIPKRHLVVHFLMFQALILFVIIREGK